jgi:hypothetical protein
MGVIGDWATDLADSEVKWDKESSDWGAFMEQTRTVKPKRLFGGVALIDSRTSTGLPKGLFPRYPSHSGDDPVDKVVVAPRGNIGRPLARCPRG